MFCVDPYTDFVQHDKEQQAGLEKRPKCEYCGKHIQDDDLFYINGEIICEDCLNDNFRHDVEIFMAN